MYEAIQAAYPTNEGSSWVSIYLATQAGRRLI